MLVINRTSNGRVFRYIHDNKCDAVETPYKLVPHLHLQPHKLSVQHWCDTYDDQVCELVETLVHAITNMNVPSNYIMHFKHKELKKQLVKWLYDASLSSNKNFKNLPQYEHL